LVKHPIDRLHHTVFNSKITLSRTDVQVTVRVRQHLIRDFRN